MFNELSSALGTVQEGMRSRNVTLAAKFTEAGFPELVKLIDN
jgi:hypothetical protein